MIFTALTMKYTEMNLITFVTEFSDMDALYANNSNYPWERGNMICGNYFHDIEKAMNGTEYIR